MRRISPFWDETVQSATARIKHRTRLVYKERISSQLYKSISDNVHQKKKPSIEEEVAFDSIPHSFLIKILEIYKVDPTCHPNDHKSNADLVNHTPHIPWKKDIQHEQNQLPERDLSR